MLHIVFKYRDYYTCPNWKTQECVVNSIKECIELYGLGKDCDYEIISVEEIKDSEVK